MDAPVHHAFEPATAASVAAHRTLLRLLAICAGVILVLAAFLIAGNIAGPLTPLHTLMRVARRTGAAGLALGSVGLGLTGVAACVAIGRDLTRRLRRLTQVALVPVLAGASGLAAWALGPLPSAPAPDQAFAVAAGLLALAFPMLVAERMTASLPSPDARPLRALMLLPVIGLTIAGAVTAAVGVGFDWATLASSVAAGAIVLIGTELAARSLGLLFLPPPEDGATVRPPLTSLIASIIAAPFGGEGFTSPLRSQLGIDFARSWALRFLRAAALPALIVTAVFCWSLTGVVALPIDQRAVYERFGAPVAVLHAGLHMILPWPFGRVRPVDGGTVRELVLGGGEAASFPAEAPPPASADRLWDQPHPGEASFLIASESSGRQGFQIVDADVRVLWRIGLSDADARHAVYGVTDPQTLLRETTGRVLADFFAVRTLDAVLGARRESMAETIRTALAAALAPLDSGIEVLDVAIEAVHPPAGAAAAYHAVQAAAIEAQSTVAREQGRARATLNQALQEARRTVDGATATAAETVQAAQAESIGFDADRAADAAGGEAFRLERYFSDIQSALANTPLTIIDNRLTDTATGPVIDLRPPPVAPSATPADPD